MNEVVEFEDNSELTVAPEPSGEPGAKNALVSKRVMPPAQLRPLLYPFAKKDVDTTEGQLKSLYEKQTAPIPYRIPWRQTAPGGQCLQVTPSGSNSYYHISAPRCVTWDVPRNYFAIMVPREVYMQGLHYYVSGLW